METEVMRKELIALIEKSDDELVERIYDMLTSDETDDWEEFTEADLKELDEQRRKRLSGESKVYTWEEAKEMIRRRKI